MSQSKATMTYRKASEQTGVIDIAGEVTGAAENALMDAYTQASSAGLRTILLNFSNLEYMNSSGIGLLVTLLIRVKRNNQKLMACGLSEHYQQIFELTRLNEAISICETETEALAMS